MHRISPRNPSFCSGLTLTELLISVAILSIVMMAVYVFGANVFTYTSQSQTQITNTWQAEAVLKPMTKELRSMIPSATGSYPIADATSSAITFFADVDNDAAIEQVRYSFSTSTLTLYRGIVEPSGSPPVYNQGSETVITLANGVQASSTLPLLQYYDSTYQGTSSPMAYPFSISSIRLIRINLTIDTDPNRSPIIRTFTSSVSLRNLKDNI